MTACGSEHGQYVVFRIGEEQYGLPVHDVKEIHRPVAITELPQAPPHIRGLANYRGQVITVVCGRKLLGLAAIPLHPGQRILLLKNSLDQFGLLVDALSAVSVIDQGRVYPCSFSGTDGWVNGLSFTGDGSFLRLLDVDKLFDRMTQKETEGPATVRGRRETCSSSAVELTQIKQKIEQYVRFQAGGISFAVPVQHVLNIQPMQDRVETLTEAPAAMIGLTAVREQIIPVFDAGMLIENIPAVKLNRIVVLELGTGAAKVLAGLAVEQATEVLRISAEEVSEIPAVLHWHRGHWVSGVYHDHKKSSFVYIIDVSKAGFTETLSIILEGSSNPAEHSLMNAGAGKQEALFLFFQMHGEDYAIPAESVKEIQRGAPVTQIPHAGGVIAGLTNIRGQLITVINLSGQLAGADSREPSGERLVVLQTGQRIRAFWVDRIIGLKKAGFSGMDQLQGLPEWLPLQEELLAGMVELTAGRMAILLNPERVCSLE